MPKKEKIKFILYLVLTPLLVGISIFVAILLCNKSLINSSSQNEEYNTQVLNAINHTHNI